MAKLGVFYALCPLIDANNLLGISEDVEKGMVIVTLGKNISSRYKLSDQKQITCWRTKEKFSSPVVYDKHFSKYVAVFNKTYIKMWDVDENLDDVKKFKLNTQIHNLITNGKVTLVVFKSGAVHELANVIEQRKKFTPEQIVNNDIKNIIYKDFDDKFYVGISVEGDDSFYWTVYNSECMKFTKIQLSRNGHSLKGTCFHQEKGKPVLLTIWSDGSMFCYPLVESNVNSTPELFSVIDFVSTDYDILMNSLDENYLALYGADTNQEGATLVIYSTQFKVPQTRQSFKLFTLGARLWLNESALFLPVGQHLAVVPFKLEVEQLATLIGSHKVVSKQIDADIKIINELDVVSWVESSKIRDRDVPDLLKDRISDFVYQGMPESMILDEVLPDILANNETEILANCLKFFSDLPEKHLANILKFVLETEIRYFRGNTSDIPGVPANLQPLERINLLDTILKKSFNAALLLPYLRSLFTLNNVLVLLEYIYLVGSEEGYVLPGLSFVETESKLIEWCSILIDSSYQKFALSNDDSVKNILEKFSQLIENHLNCLRDLEEVAPLVEQIKQQKIASREKRYKNSRYTIEQLTFYS